MLSQYLTRVQLLGRRLHSSEFFSELKDIAYMSRIKRCIHRNLRDGYWYNTDFFFKRWRFQAQQLGHTKKNRDMKATRELQRSADKRLEQRIDSFERDGTALTESSFMRKVLTGFRKFVLMKKNKRRNRDWLQKELNTRHCREFIHLLRTCTKKKVKVTRKLK